MACLGLMETGSNLIREKCKHLSKMSDRVSQMFWSASAQGLKGREIFIEVYIDNRRIFVIIYTVKVCFAIFSLPVSVQVAGLNL